LDGLWSAFVGGLGGAVVAIVGAWVQGWIGARIKVDEGLRAKREVSYLDLWRLTSLLPEWPRADNVTYGKLGELSRAMREWYFQGGGLYLSRQSRNRYGNVQEALQPLLAKPADAVIAPAEYNGLQKLCSRLRTELTSDLLSRERNALSFADNLPWTSSGQRASR
jgi:hypothetical protein